MNWFRARRTTSPAPRVRLNLEGVEDRSLPAPLTAGGLFDPIPLGRAAAVNVYTETNNPNPGQNAVLGFHRNADGSLTRFGSFATGGTGQLNVPKAVGPDDGTNRCK